MVDLEQFREAVEFMLMHGTREQCIRSGDMLQAIIDNAHQPAPVVDEAARLMCICQDAHDRLLRGDDDRELLAILEQAWMAREAVESP